MIAPGSDFSAYSKWLGGGGGREGGPVIGWPIGCSDFDFFSHFEV